MKVGLYTVTYNGLFYKGGFLPLEECIAKAINFGFDGIELEAKRPHASPLDLDKDARKKLKDLCQSKGLEIPAVAAYSNFTSPVMIRRENELLMLREIIRLASDLGARIVRIFAAWRGWTLRNGYGTYDMVCKYEYPDVTRLEQWNWCKECIKESAKFAEDRGITLALQNHAPLINCYRDMLDMVSEVGSDFVKCCLDAPCEPCQDDDYIIKAVKETGNLQVLSHVNGEWARNSKGELVYIKHCSDTKLANYPVFIKALKEIGYDGYIDFEFCHPAQTHHQPAGIEYVDKQTAYALEYIRKLIQSA